MGFPGRLRAVVVLALGAGFLVFPTPVLAANPHAAHTPHGVARGHSKSTASAAAPVAVAATPTPALAATPAPAPVAAAPAVATQPVSSPGSTPGSTVATAPAPRAAATAVTAAGAGAGATRSGTQVVGTAAYPAAAAGSGVQAAPAAVAPARGLRLTPALEGFPDVVLPPGPEGIRIAVGLLVLPLLAGIWLWALARIGAAVLAERDARTRELLAMQLGLAPAELVGVRSEGLRKLRDQVAFDELTGVARRAAGMAALDREASRARRDGLALSIAFVDVDMLKWTNDHLGHEAGDHLLRGISALLTGRLRGHDVVFRYGGDEFVAVLPATNARVADSILAEIRERAVRSGLSFSYGVTELGPGEDAQEAIARADARQYEDKRARKAGRAPAEA